GRHRAALAVDVQTDGHGVKISLSGGGAAAFLAYGCSHCARRSYWRPGGCGRRRRASQVGWAKAYRTDVCRSDKPCPRGSTSQQSHAASLDSAGTELRAKGAKLLCPPYETSLNCAFVAAANSAKRPWLIAARRPSIRS